MMTTGTANTRSGFLPAVLTGIGITLATGAILAPVVYIVFNSLFNLYIFSTPPPDAWINDAIIIGTCVAWLFVSAAAGGWACARASKKQNAYSHALLLSVLWTVIAIIIFTWNQVEETDVYLIVSILGPAGYFTGTMLRIRKQKKIQEQKKQLPDNP